MEKEERIREAILGAAERLFRKWGIGKTTMDDIAREAGKGKSSIYYYFPNKESVIEAVATVQAEQIIASVRREVDQRETGREKLLAYVATAFRETRRAITLFEIARGDFRANRALIDGVMERYRAMQEELVDGILRHGIRRKEFRSIGEEDVGPAVHAIVTIMRSLILDMFLESDDVKVIDLIIEILSKGL